MKDTSALSTATLGYPRIGRNREMKKALENYWSDVITETTLKAISDSVLNDALTTQSAAPIDSIAVGDHTLYDHVLDWTLRFGCIPSRFQNLTPGLPTYFAMARGVDSAPALDMSKYFGTNYHYMVPELDQHITPTANFDDFLHQIHLAQNQLGSERVVPNVLGPVTYVHISRLSGIEPAQMLDKLLPLYTQLLNTLKSRNVPEVQIHEPALVLSEAASLRDLYQTAFASLAACQLPINLVTFFDDVHVDVFPWMCKLPGLSAISLDFTRGNNLVTLKKCGFPSSPRLGAGIVDGRSVWTDQVSGRTLLAAIKDIVGDNVKICVQPSCSLQYVPIDVDAESSLPEEIRPKLHFAVQKLKTVAEIAASPESTSSSELTGIVEEAVADALQESLFVRQPKFEERRPQQFTVPGGFGTTTIGSFSQTPEIRRLHTQHRKGTMSDEEYNARIDKELAYVIGIQEALGLDVFVHGEPERTDMVEYFGVKLSGFTFTTKGWVQSYGNRYVRPPIIYGDVTRTEAMTVREFKSAQSMTTKPVKGMLTAATTILNWSFPRKDISREQQAYQIGLALRQEVMDLEKAGCKIIQVDDPALREGLPLKRENWEEYLRWAVRAFRLSTSGVLPSTQIVTHLCYSDFEDILDAIDGMDADVLTIENSRSGDEMLVALAKYGYSRDIGPGVYDIHSPVVPKTATMASRIKLFKECGLASERIWVNPDCGLKTRKWKEVLPSLTNMVEAAKIARIEDTRTQ
ncbi:5-methyltetrahydropteroyltriglutamate--homocysteine methyltransferase [Gracilariopsis chorda]|uniref:5-methyltetrahydropteroyltriglutamate--homocysteine S-methyltransferase n=1 Tax=Gracilariopsis chorda TaxID=448386 RepID=A0A2V3IZ31_9FLOR|nr:5-methyltetrahydropteroyltriglutamate--homocysteine methyltransferase [Gracilariopsis chorda]|eukprot:PXF47408.1 5-methyltetrahydropteroyltriglutamate--homocysteine methyltransferase [Gracilariopsis chorda]